MKIISGSLKGREIIGFNIPGTRPTMDRVKESVFAMVQSHIRDSVVLDLFAGSGNYGLEALSNGSKYVYFNDHNHQCIKVINQNLTKFQLKDQASVTNLDYLKALNYYAKQSLQFDLVFLDPPYKEHIIENIIQNLLDNHLLKEQGLIICEVDKPLLFNYENIILLKSRRYGDKQVYIYQFKSLVS